MGMEKDSGAEKGRGWGTATRNLTPMEATTPAGTAMTPVTATGAGNEERERNDVEGQGGVTAKWTRTATSMGKYTTSATMTVTSIRRSLRSGHEDVVKGTTLT